MPAAQETLMTQDTPICECKKIHLLNVIDGKAKLLEDDTASDVANLFKVFGDPTRIKILQSLVDQELCVCDITEILGMTQSAISHQLRVLKQASLVKYRKEGKQVFYSLDDNHVLTILCQGLDHVMHL